jgi:hypothetical protein
LTSLDDEGLHFLILEAFIFSLIGSSMKKNIRTGLSIAISEASQWILIRVKQE